MKVLILTADSNGAYPVPATKGGAVATLIEYLVEGNNDREQCKLEVVSYYEERAYEKSKQYPHVKFTWVRIPKMVTLLDRMAFNFIRIMKKDEKAVSFKTPFSLLYYIHNSRKIIKYTDADKIVIENNIPLALCFKNTKYKGQWYYHLHNVPRIDAKSRDVMQRTTKFLCVSQFVANEICSEKSAIGKVPSNKVEILYNCIDTDLFRPIKKDNQRIIELRARYGFQEEDRILIFTGRLTEEKGADVLLAAMKKLPNNVKALIVGSFHYNAEVKSDYQNKLHKMAEELGKRVIFTGYVQHDDLPYLYNLADIAILPSMWDEPAGLTNLEAMACGTPIITTNAGGIPEYIGEGTAYKRDDNLVNNIVKEVNRLIEDPQYYQNKSYNGHQLVEKNFNKNIYIDNLVKCLN